MRRYVEGAITVLCVVLALLGLALVLWLGPDSRRTTGPHAIDTDGSLIVTKPGVISWTGVNVDILATLPVNKPVFVGLGNAVDVLAYTEGAAKREVIGFDAPWKPTTREVKGVPYLPGAPTAVNWWIDSGAGLGTARMSTVLPDETTSLVIASVGSSDLSGLEVTLAYGLEGGFAKGIGLILVGAGGYWLMWLLKHGARIWAERRAIAWRADEIEEVVYVWVDDAGVEHEVHPGDPEYDEFAAAEERGDEPEPEPEPEPKKPKKSKKSNKPKKPAAPAEPVVYVWVDDDGVEHEISADELNSDMYEVVDDEEDGR